MRQIIVILIAFICVSCGKEQIDGIYVSPMNLKEYNELLLDLGNDGQFDTRVESFSSITIDQSTIVFIGSSTIAKWVTLEGDFAPLSVINRGLGGARMSQIIIHSEDLFYSDAPDKVVLYIGDNDAEYYDIGTFIRYMDLFVRNFHHRLPNSKLYLISVKPSPSREQYFDYYNNVNLLEESLSNNINVFYINIWDEMYDNIPSQYFIEDMLHLNEKGYELIKNKLRPLLLEDN